MNYRQIRHSGVGRNPVIYCPFIESVRGLRRQKYWIPAYAGMTVNGMTV